MATLKVGDLIRKSEQDYINGETTIGKYVSFSQYENIEKIDAYLNSKHTSGLTDSLGREKPFFNIVTGAVNIWYRATDIDRKHIRIKATKSKDYIKAFLATIHLQQWMKDSGFGMVLNEWGRSLARYGSSVLKFVEKGGKLNVSVVSWNRLISDTVDFENNPKIEKLYMTPAQLLENKNYDKAKVKDLINALEARETLGGEKKDNITEYIEIYELHGLLTLDNVTGKEQDKDTYTQQMHIVSFVKNEETGEYDDYCLFSGREEKDPYFITHLIKEDGRSQAIGAVEHLFEAQWMTNHSAKAIKDQLDLASKVIFQTADGSFTGTNALSNIENGDILIHAPDKPLSQINNSSHDITSLLSFGDRWQLLAKEITSTPDSISGNTMPSGTAYRQVAILNQESHSLFEIMTENKGLAIEAMFRKYVIPFLMKKMDSVEEISTTLETYDLTKLDAIYFDAELIRRKNKYIKDYMLKDNGKGGEIAPEFDLEAERRKLQADFADMGNQRFIKPSDIDDVKWKDVLNDFVWECEVEVTAEQTDKEAIMTTLSTVLQTIANNPQVLQDPNMKLLFNKILEITGAVSAIEISANATPTVNPATQTPEQIQQALNPTNKKVGGGQPTQVGGGVNY